MDHPRQSYVTHVLVLFICGVLLGCGEPESQTDSPAREDLSIESRIDGEAHSRSMQAADSLKNLVNQRLRQRNYSGLDSLIEHAARAYLALDSTAAGDSLRWAGYFSVQAYRASYLRELGRFQECLELAEESIRRVRKRFGEKSPLLASFYNVKSANYLIQGALDSSKVNASRAIEILLLQPMLNKKALVGSHLRLARAGFQGFDFIGSIEHVNQAIDYASQSNDGKIDSIALGAAYNTRAGVHYSLQEYEHTIADLDRAYRLTAANPFWEATYKMNVAGVLAEVGHLDEALSLNREATNILKSMKPTPQENLSIVRYNLGIIYMDQGVYDSAAVYLEEMLAWRKAHQPQQLMLLATNQNSLAYVYTQQGRLAEAKKLFNQSEAIYRTQLPPHHPEWNRYDRLLSGYYEAAGQHAAALKAAQHALNCALMTPAAHPLSYNPPADSVLLKDHALKAYVKKARIQLTLAGQQPGDRHLDRCLSTVTAAIQLVDRMRADYQQAHFRRLLNDHARSLYTTGIRAAIERYRRSGDSAYLEKAFEFSTRSKGGMLRDIQRELNARRYADFPDSLRQQEARLQTRIWRTEVTLNLLQSGGYQDKAYRRNAARDTLRELWIRYSELKRDMQHRFPGYRALMYTAPAFSLARLRQQPLDEKMVLIDVFNSEDQLYLFLVRQDSIALHQLSFSDSLVDRLAALQQNIVGRRTDFDAFSDNAYRLYADLLGPLETYLEDRSLVFIPDRALYATPIAALLTEPPAASRLKSYADLPYLVRRHPVRYTYSAALLLPSAAAAPALPPENSFIAFAPGFMDGLPPDTMIYQATMGPGQTGDEGIVSGPLPYSESEVTRIRDRFLERGSALPLWLARLFDRSTRLQLNRSATETGLLSAELDRYRYVHFSTHGFFYPPPAPLAGLLLYPDQQNDGIIFPADIYRLKLNAELVVLSACQTALGEWSTGEGLIGPAQAFLQAGAENLLVTLWQTENRSAGDLMLRFYQEMLSGKQKANALQVAQLSMLESEDFQHPRYWAPYILIGR